MKKTLFSFVALFSMLVLSACSGQQMPSSDIQEESVEDDYGKGRIDSCYVDGQLIVYDYHYERNKILCYLDLNKPGYSYTRHEIDKDAYNKYRESFMENLCGGCSDGDARVVSNAALTSFSEDTIRVMIEKGLFPFNLYIKYDWNGKIRSVAFRIKPKARPYFDGRQIIKMTENIKREVKFPPMYPKVGHSVAALIFPIHSSHAKQQLMNH